MDERGVHCSGGAHRLRMLALCVRLERRAATHGRLAAYHAGQATAAVPL